MYTYLYIYIYRYSANGLSLEFYWNVIWDVPERVRSECKVTFAHPPPIPLCCGVSNLKESEECSCGQSVFSH